MKTTRSFDSYTQVWASDTPIINCNAGIRTGTFYSKAQAAALTSAGYEQTSAALGFLYARCADLGTDDPPEGYWSSAYAALMLCPEHPDAAEIVRRADNALAAERSAADAQAAKAAEDAASEAQRQQDIQSGLIVLSGLYKVGAGIEPGTYVSEGKMENCYWETLDSTAAIIENAFILSAFRAEVVISSSDYSFSSRGCGEWRRVT